MQSQLDSKKQKMKKSSKHVENNPPGRDNRPSFLKMVKFNGNASHKLIIPRDFVRKYLPKTVPTRAILKGPSGDCWNITMCQNEGNMIMQHGWPQFYQDQSLGNNEVLIFRHNGDMCFDVQIFYKNGFERKNVPITRARQDPAEEIKQEEIDIADVVQTEPQLVTRGEGKSSEDKIPGSSSRQQSPAQAGQKSKGKLCKAAEDFTSNFPHFKHCLTNCNVNRPFLLNIPASFVNAKYLPEARTTFTFRTSDSEQKSWEVSYVYSETNKLFSGGWNIFAKDNKLKIDDSCVFELVAPQQMRVHIFLLPQNER